jgi:ABC-2 type transport system ATP-binding protein
VVLDDDKLVTSARRESDGVEVLLAPDADPQQLLRALIESGAKIEKFEVVEPSLHDIFIGKVTESL